MGRPRAVKIETFSQYDKLHTRKVKMYSGVEMTALYPIKETEEYYRSVESWSYCVSTFKGKKKNVTLEVNIPIITNQKTIEFLKKNAWTDWVRKQKDKNNSEMIEAVGLLKKIFPDKEAVYFYELESLLSAYNHGTFISFDDNGEVNLPSELRIDEQKYYNTKYNRFIDNEECIKMRKRWTEQTDETLKIQYLSEYLDFESEFGFKHNNHNETFINIGQNAVVYPVAFTKGTADWYIEKYGKVCSYAHAGEIYFVVTDEQIFFEVKRHF